MYECTLCTHACLRVKGGGRKKEGRNEGRKPASSQPANVHLMYVPTYLPVVYVRLNRWMTGWMHACLPADVDNRLQGQN